MRGRVVGEREPFGQCRGERHLGLGEREDAGGIVRRNGSRDRIGVESGRVDDLTDPPKQPHQSSS